MKIFLDSSVLIEYENGRNQALFETLLDNSKLELCLNSVVASEFFYKLLGILSNRSPMAISESKKIKETLDKHETESFLSYFTLLDTPNDAIILSLALMKKHNLLPNDALILASCKIENIAVLVSFDSDFTDACRYEEIRLINTKELALLL